MYEVLLGGKRKAEKEGINSGFNRVCRSEAVAGEATSDLSASFLIGL